MVTFALTVTPHVAACAVVHPVQELKVCVPLVVGAVMVTAVPAL